MGRADPLCPGTSDVDLLGDRVDFDAKIANRALDFAVAQYKLNRSQIPGPPIDERRFRSPQRMRPKEAWVQSDSGNPVRYQSRVLPGRDGHPATGWPTKRGSPGFFPAALKEQALNTSALGLFVSLETERL